MNKKYRCLVLIGILIACLFMYNSQRIKEDAAIAEMEAVIAESRAALEEVMTKNIVFDEPYTMIVNHSSPMYLSSLEVPVEVMDKAIRWTHPNGVSGFDICMGDSYIRYIEGHIEGKQLPIYAPYIYIDEEFVFE
jgi:hypothetical protein